jgi:hypothetical protein
MGETADTNLASDQAWFRKNQEAQEQYYNDMMTAISTGALPIGAAASGGGGGGGGGGGYGGRHYGGGGGGSGGGDGNLGYGDTNTELTSNESLDSKATNTNTEYSPEFWRHLEAMGATPEEVDKINALIATSSQDPRGVQAAIQEEMDANAANVISPFEDTQTNNQQWRQNIPDIWQGAVDEYLTRTGQRVDMEPSQVTKTDEGLLDEQVWDENYNILSPQEGLTPAQQEAFDMYRINIMGTPQEDEDARIEAIIRQAYDYTGGKPLMGAEELQHLAEAGITKKNEAASLTPAQTIAKYRQFLAGNGQPVAPAPGEVDPNYVQHNYETGPGGVPGGTGPPLAASEDAAGVIPRPGPANVPPYIPGGGPFMGGNPFNIGAPAVPQTEEEQTAAINQATGQNDSLQRQAQRLMGMVGNTWGSYTRPPNVQTTSTGNPFNIGAPATAQTPEEQAAAIIRATGAPDSDTAPGSTPAASPFFDALIEMGQQNGGSIMPPPVIPEYIPGGTGGNPFSLGGPQLQQTPEEQAAAILQATGGNKPSFAEAMSTPEALRGRMAGNWGNAPGPILGPATSEFGSVPPPQPDESNWQGPIPPATINGIPNPTYQEYLTTTMGGVPNQENTQLPSATGGGPGNRPSLVSAALQAIQSQPRGPKPIDNPAPNPTPDILAAIKNAGAISGLSGLTPEITTAYNAKALPAVPDKSGVAWDPVNNMGPGLLAALQGWSQEELEADVNSRNYLSTVEDRENYIANNVDPGQYYQDMPGGITHDEYNQALRWNDLLYQMAQETREGYNPNYSMVNTKNQQVNTAGSSIDLHAKRESWDPEAAIPTAVGALGDFSDPAVSDIVPPAGQANFGVPEVTPTGQGQDEPDYTLDPVQTGYAGQSFFIDPAKKRTLDIGNLLRRNAAQMLNIPATVEKPIPQASSGDGGGKKTYSGGRSNVKVTRKPVYVNDKKKRNDKGK